MARKKLEPFDYLRRMLLKRRAGLADHRPVNHAPDDGDDPLESLDVRLRRMLDIVTRDLRNPKNMIFFVMYDIESNKVRRSVVKYLERMGCHRVQKSIFLADLPADTMARIQADLAEVQAMYDNQDSIMVVPLSLEQVKTMHIIGQRIDLDLIVKTRSTMFF